MTFKEIETLTPMNVKMVGSIADCMPTSRIGWHDFVLFAIGAASLLADVYVVRTILNNRCLQTPTRLYIVNWVILDIIYLFCAEGISNFVELIVDPEHEFDFIVLTLQKTLQGNLLLFPIFYLIDVNIQKGKLKTTHCLRFLWIQCLISCFVISFFITHIAQEVSLCGVALFALLICFSLYEIETTFYFGRRFSRCKKIMLALIAVHVISWFVHCWVVVGVATGGWEHLEAYEFIALCLAHVSTLDKFYILIRFDKVFRFHIRKLEPCCLPDIDGVSHRQNNGVLISTIVNKEANKITKKGSIDAETVL